MAAHDPIPLQGNSGAIRRLKAIDTGRQFRLLKLQHSTDLTVCVQASIETYDWHEEHPPFDFLDHSTAFSTAFLAPISLNGECSLVTQGFETVVRFMSLDTMPKFHYIFATALCITPSELRQDASGIQQARHKASGYLDALAVIARLPERDLTGLSLGGKAHAYSGEEKTVILHDRMLEGTSGQTEHLTRLYQPLDRVVCEFRILRLDLVDDEIMFSLHSMRHEEIDGNYIAVSYTWGTDEASMTIQVSGHQVEVRRNLHSLLMEISRVYKDRANDGAAQNFWIDALCINQADAIEKMWQVQRMGQIFDKARAVMAWLDESDEDCLSAIPSLPDNQAGQVLMAPNGLRPDTVTLLAETYLRPYFTRAWIIQELVFGKRVWVAAGGSRRSWADIAVFCPFHSDLRRYVSLIYSMNGETENKYQFLSGLTFARIQLVTRLKARHAMGRAVTLLSLLLALINVRATLPKDKIYSLWALADDAADLLLMPDYSKDDGQVYMDFAQAWITKYDRLDILAVRSIPRNGGVRTCPLWAPDWSDDTRRARPFLSKFPGDFGIDMLDDIENTRMYNADGGIGKLVSRFSSTTVPASLLTAGLFCGVIQYLGPVAPPNGKPGEEWESFVDDHLPGSLTKMKDFYNALIAGRTPDGTRCDGLSVHKMYWPSEDGDTEMFRRSMRQHIYFNIVERRIAITTSGHLGLVPYWTQTGDEVAVIFGCSVPLILRKLCQDESAVIIGDCYFQRMMDGQMVNIAGGKEACIEAVYKHVSEHEIAGAGGVDHAPAETLLQPRGSCAGGGEMTKIARAAGGTDATPDNIPSLKDESSDMHVRLYVL